MLFTVYEMKRLGRDAAELTVLVDHLTAHGLALEMLAGPLPGGAGLEIGEGPKAPPQVGSSSSDGRYRMPRGRQIRPGLLESGLWHIKPLARTTRTSPTQVTRLNAGRTATRSGGRP
ncbi:hypothetical protein AB0F25_28285 [Streptomyces wedmorensis]|uniref:hypothetical protein n=1 Tax=Streptomyces wedmorensis TaxID=43759 RepID=UPI003432FF53